MIFVRYDLALNDVKPCIPVTQDQKTTYLEHVLAVRRAAGGAIVPHTLNNTPQTNQLYNNANLSPL